MWSVSEDSYNSRKEAAGRYGHQLMLFGKMAPDSVGLFLDGRHSEKTSKLFEGAVLLFLLLTLGLHMRLGIVGMVQVLMGPKSQ